MAKYKAYPEYKDSGVEWLGRIPRHWVCSVLKRLCSLTTGLTPPTTNEDNYAEEGYPWVRPEDINENGLETQASKFVSYTGWKLLRHIEPNSTLICCIGTIGKCGYVRETISTNQQITAATFYNSERFYFYLMQAARTQLEELATGNVLKILNSERLGSLNMVKVEEKEATSIAVFLDHETAKIDNLIEKQQQLIELLKEKRQAVISHAVTKGLNPDAPMKDSGVEWLGEVPEHWRVSRIKNYAKIESGHTPSKTKSEYWVNCNIPWVSLNDSKQLKNIDYIEDTFYKISELGMANSSAHLLPARAVVFTRDASIGLSAITTKQMAVSQHLIAWICNEKFIIPEFLLLVFYAMEAEFERYTFGATIKTIGMDNVRSLKSAFPSIEEQHTLIYWAFKQVENIKVSISKVEDMIDLLQERRTALISAAVTGKIDVRDWVTPDTSHIEASEEATA